ncbi:LOW QUALITY PROTEIN: uncharacterized protein LOC143299204 [Babylonia areolata]|uniref:LOW QUALITY PROTEIN: uncharacterized protein LOC143299204 n=1 Tax=Babylonia areolata TaxID=304850 RepID=UPI003FD0FF3D
MASDLLTAAKNGYYNQVVSLLSTASCDVNSRDKDKATPLYWSASRGHDKICQALLQAGCDVNACVKWGSTALHAAADRGHADCLSVLLDCGADVQVQNERGDTALHLAAYRGYRDLVRLLVATGRADPFLKNAHSKTPLQEAQAQQHTAAARLLQQYMESLGCHPFKSLPASEGSGRQSLPPAEPPSSSAPAQSWPRYHQNHLLTSSRTTCPLPPHPPSPSPTPPPPPAPIPTLFSSSTTFLRAVSGVLPPVSSVREPPEERRRLGATSGWTSTGMTTGLKGLPGPPSAERLQQPPLHVHSDPQEHADECAEWNGRVRHSERERYHLHHQHQHRHHVDGGGGGVGEEKLYLGAHYHPTTTTTTTTNGARLNQLSRPVSAGGHHHGADVSALDASPGGPPRHCAQSSTDGMWRHQNGGQDLVNGVNKALYHHQSDVQPPPHVPTSKHRSHGFVNHEDLTLFAESLQLEVVKLRESLSSKEQRVSELESLTSSLQAQNTQLQELLTDHLNESQHSLASKDAEMSDLQTRLRDLETQNLHLQQAVAEGRASSSHVSVQRESQVQELTARVRDLEHLNNSLQQLLVSQQSTLKAALANKDREIAALMDTVTALASSQKPATSTSTPVTLLPGSSVSPSSSADRPAAAPAAATRQPHTPGADSPRSLAAGTGSMVQPSPGLESRSAVLRSIHDHSASAPRASSLQTHASSQSWSQTQAGTHLPQQLLLPEEPSRTSRGDDGVEDTTTLSATSSRTRLSTTDRGPPLPPPSFPSSSSTPLLPRSTSQAGQVADGVQQCRLRASVSRLFLDPAVDTGRLDSDGREWTEGREFQLLDSTPVNCPSDGQRRGSCSLVFRIRHQGHKYMLKMLTNLINLSYEGHSQGRSLDAHLLHCFGTEFHAPLLLHAHPNVVRVRHHYQGDTGRFARYLPLLMPPSLDVPVEMASRTTFLVLEHYPLCLQTFMERFWRERGKGRGRKGRGKEEEVAVARDQHYKFPKDKTQQQQQQQPSLVACGGAGGVGVGSTITRDEAGIEEEEEDGEDPPQLHPNAFQHQHQDHDNDEEEEEKEENLEKHLPPHHHLQDQREEQQFFLQMVYQLLSAVDYLQRHEVVHRDIKADNVFLDWRLRPVLGDFGLARTLRGPGGQAPASFTDRSQVLAGNSHAWAPELCRWSRADPSTLSQPVTLKDIYSKADGFAVARMFYHLFHRHHPDNDDNGDNDADDDDDGNSSRDERFPTSTLQHPHYPDSAVHLLPAPVSPGLAHVLRSLLLDDPSTRPSVRQALCRVGVLLCKPDVTLTSEEEAEAFCVSQLLALSAECPPAVSQPEDETLLTVAQSVTANQNHCLADFLLNFSGKDFWEAYTEMTKLGFKD